MPDPIQFDDLGVINQALTGVMGEDEITNLEDDQAKAAIIMRKNYEAVSEAAQVKTAWRFNTTKVALNKLSGAPENRWAAAWQLPPNLLKVLTTWPPSNYEIQGNKLYSNNTSSIELDYQRKIGEGLWPIWFTRYVVAMLVMRTVRGVTGEKPSQTMKDEREEAERDALFQDAQQQPNQTIFSNAFVDVRR